MNESLVGSFFDADHDRLDKELISFMELKGQNPEFAEEAFSRFRIGLLRHMMWEEVFLFPAYQKASPESSREFIDVMKREHIKIKECLSRLSEVVGACIQPLGSEEAELMGLLAAHHNKEESILYPNIDQWLTENERRTLIQQIKESQKNSRY